MKKLIAKFRLKNEDLIAQQEDAIKHTKIHKKARVMQLVVTLLILLFGLIIGDYSKGGILTALVFYTLLIPAVWKLYPILMVKRFKQGIKEHKNRTGNFTVTLSQEGITSESENVTKRTAWSDINYVTQDKERYFLYLTDLDVMIIRKKPDDINDAQSDEYQTFLHRKVGSLKGSGTSFIDKIKIKHYFYYLAIILLIIIGVFVYRWMFTPQMSETYSGESEHWEVQDYEIHTDKRVSLKDGKLSMKGENEFWADYFQSSTHIVLNDGSEIRPVKAELKADTPSPLNDDDVMNVAEYEIGASGGVYLTNYWMPLTINNIEEEYVNVQWIGEGDDHLKEENIILTPKEM